MKTFASLSNEDRARLLSFPACISLLAANNDDQLDEEEKQAAIRFAHVKTYSSDPALKDFYREADAVFEKNITALDLHLPKETDARAMALKKELQQLNTIVDKLGKEDAEALRASMKSFKDHVSKAHRNVLEYFIFPMTTDEMGE